MTSYRWENVRIAAPQLGYLSPCTIDFDPVSESGLPNLETPQATCKEVASKGQTKQLLIFFTAEKKMHVWGNARGGGESSRPRFGRQKSGHEEDKGSCGEKHLDHRCHFLVQSWGSCFG